MEKPLVNRVAQSKLITIDLEKHYPSNEIVEIDLKDYLFKELILKEKDFRTAVDEFDTSAVQDKLVGIFCSTDAIIPTWAFMLMAAKLSPHATNITFGDKNTILDNHYKTVIKELEPTLKQDGLFVVKGCSKKEVPVSAYVEITKLLQPIAKSIMFGEPCSTVPIYKKPRN